MKRLWERNVDVPNMGENLEDCREYRYNKEKAYKEGLEEFIQFSERVNINKFEEFIQFSEKVNISNKTWLIHPNVNMYIDTTSICNGNCKFCIAKTTYERTDLDTGNFIKRLKKVFCLLQNINCSVQVVGGEPTISPKIYPILDIIDNSKMNRPALGTNGSGLNDELVERINQSRIQHINVSRHHYHENINHEIMHLNPFFSNGRFWKNLEGIDKKTGIRLQCNLIKGYIDSYEEVMKFINWAEGHGITNLAFAQLTPLPENDIYKQEIIEYVTNRQVDVDLILENIENNADFTFEKYRGGVACYYEIWKYKKDITVMFKFSDNKYLVMVDLLKIYLPDLVFHTDGTLCGSWNKDLKIL